MDIKEILAGYDSHALTIGTLGGHSALDVCSGAKAQGLQSICIAQQGREQTYDTFYKTRNGRGCVDHIITVDSFEDVLKQEIQKRLQQMNTIFIQSRYFWVYFSTYSKVEHTFAVPFFGNRTYVQLEERDQEFNQYDLLKNAGIRIPKLFSTPKEIDRLCVVKAAEKDRTYERAFFLAENYPEWEAQGTTLEAEGKVGPSWRTAVIEEFVVGAPVNFNFFYSPLSGELELMGTDTRRQTNLDGLLRLPSDQQQKVLQHVPLKMIETGHVACTIKESLLEQAFALGKQFVQATKDYDGKGIIGPFALQGAVVAEDGKEEIVIFDVSLRIPGSPGSSATPYSTYLHGRPVSMGERIAMEIKHAVAEGRLEEVLT